MNYKIYIQSLNNFPVADWAISAYMGFRDRQADIIFFENIEEVPVSKYNIVVAFIEDTNKYLEKLGLQPKKALNIPWQLHKEEYLGREVKEMFLLSLYNRNIVLGQSFWPRFIKPAGKAKEFIAGVVKSEKDAKIFFNDLSSTTRILTSEVVDFISEYRTYIVNGEIKGIKHYLGDFFVYPDPEIIKKMVKEYTHAPAGYSLDVGITKEGRTLLVECNDGWSLGNYGLNNSIYVNLLTARWLEMMKGEKSRIGKYHRLP